MNKIDFSKKVAVYMRVGKPKYKEIHNEELENTKVNKDGVAIYIRVANNLGNLELKTQKSDLHYFLNDHKILDFKEYIDEGYNGRNFERPAFKKLIEDVKKGEIKTLIIYNLSRISRSIEDVFYYVNDFFPSYNVKLISLCDHLDSNRGFMKEISECNKKKINDIEFG